jgi:hypothetical protein
VPPRLRALFSPYDGASWSKAADLDIDHWFPWRPRGGAESRKDRRTPQGVRQRLTHHQLIAVTDKREPAKGRQIAGPVEAPLPVTDAEKTALAGMLDRC